MTDQELNPRVWTPAKKQKISWESFSPLSSLVPVLERKQILTKDWECSCKMSLKWDVLCPHRGTALLWRFWLPTEKTLPFPPRVLNPKCSVQRKGFHCFCFRISSELRLYMIYKHNLQQMFNSQSAKCWPGRKSLILLCLLLSCWFQALFYKQRKLNSVAFEIKQLYQT